MWADDEAAGGGPHLAFKLGASGEQVALYDPQGKAIDLLSWTGAQDDVSYARVPDGRAGFVVCAAPTCGAANANSCR